MQWLNDVFGVTKPVIAMLHLGALPGDPSFDTDAGVRRVVDNAKRDLDALQSGGVDAVLISNEFSLPYLTKTEAITAITMARVIGELLDDLTVPFGANVLWDGVASIDLAAATGAAFVREIFTGVYASDFGLWNTNIGQSARHRRRVDASGVRLLFNVVPEATAYLADRELGRDYTFHSVQRTSRCTGRVRADRRCADRQFGTVNREAECRRSARFRQYWNDR